MGEDFGRDAVKNDHSNVLIMEKKMIIFLKNVVAMHVYGWNKIPELLEIFILMWCHN